MRDVQQGIELGLSWMTGDDEAVLAAVPPVVAATIVQPLDAKPSTSTSTYVLGFGSVLALAAIGIAVMNKEKEEKDYHEKLLSAYVDDETQ